MSQERKRDLGAVGVLATLALAMFADVLFNGGTMLSRAGYDGALYFYWVRDWGFAELAKGNLPLWNPHMFNGVPFFGNFQSALLYPPNWIFLVLPTALAMNWSIAVHVFLAGLFTYIWCRRRAISTGGALLAGILFMFCGAYFFKIVPGYFAFIYAAAWMPVIFLCIDSLFKTGRLWWVLPGGAAVAMQVLCGGPQYAYNTALAAGLYTLLNLTRDRERWRSVLLGVALIYILGTALCAVQVLPGLQLAEESARSDGMAFGSASAAPFAPWAFLTLLSSQVLPDSFDSPLQNTILVLSLNISVAGLVLAVYGAARGDRKSRRFAVTMIVILCVLAMGSYTPVYQWLYDYVPGFKVFRVMARFTVLACLFMTTLAGIGFDRIRETASDSLKRVYVMAAVAVMVGMMAAGVLLTADSKRYSLWGNVVKAADLSGKQYRKGLRTREGESRSILRQDARHVGKNLAVSGLLLVVTTGVLVGIRRRPGMANLLIVLAGAELFVVGRAGRETMTTPLPVPEPWRKVYENAAPEERIFTAKWGWPPRAMGFRTYDANGYEAAVLTRYWDFYDLLRDDTNKGILRYPGICQMLRITHLLYFIPQYRRVDHKTAVPEESEAMVEQIPHRPLGRVALVDDCRVLKGSKAVLEAVASPDFDPGKLVILDAQPAIRPEKGGAAGTAKVVRMSSDWLEIEAEAPKAALLLVTEAYSKHWKATPLEGSCQKKYQVMPANHLLRAIPLGEGKHRLRLEYRPSYFDLGRWITLGTIGVYALAGGCWIVRRRSWRAA